MVKVIFQASPEFIAKLQKLQLIKQFALQSGGQAVYVYLIEYHKKMDWKGRRWIPGAYSGTFAQMVVRGWQPPVILGDHVKVTNKFGLLDWKIKGGTIRPKVAKALTIPLVSTAKGISAAQYSAVTGQKLFSAGGSLCERIGKKVEAVYALRQSVAQAPWPGAMPPDSDLKDAFIAGVEAGLHREWQ